MAALLGAAVDLGHQKDLVAVVVLRQCPAHQFFAAAVVVVPTVVHEIDAAVDAGACSQPRR